MKIQQLQHAIIEGLEEVKGQDIKAFNVSHLTELFQQIYIVTGTSKRHTTSLAHRVAKNVKAAGGDILSIEGTETGEWVLVDCNDAIVHIFLPMIREYYNLDEIWGGKPITLK